MVFTRSNLRSSKQDREAGGLEMLVVGEGFGKAEPAHDGKGYMIDDACLPGFPTFVGGPCL